MLLNVPYLLSDWAARGEGGMRLRKRPHRGRAAGRLWVLRQGGRWHTGVQTNNKHGDVRPKTCMSSQSGNRYRCQQIPPVWASHQILVSKHGPVRTCHLLPLLKQSHHHLALQFVWKSRVVVLSAPGLVRPRQEAVSSESPSGQTTQPNASLLAWIDVPRVSRPARDCESQAQWIDIGPARPWHVPV